MDNINKSNEVYEEMLKSFDDLSWVISSYDINEKRIVTKDMYENLKTGEIKNVKSTSPNFENKDIREYLQGYSR
ncbi:MAG: hypothetical protein N4A47_01665 [Clostridia bacterium]|jgi:hypothetical protein|nr:hypothetical protein [Clostridia bacterium]